ncbi:MAG: DUF3006 domain-containing protein [Treponema sp.]|nr:DUF3006 domain-containing protein [Treponema sp.]
MHYIIDRIESGIAVCNSMATGASPGGGEDIEIPVSELPPHSKEGNVLIKTNDGYVYDAELTAKRRANLTDRMNRLFDKNIK